MRWDIGAYREKLRRRLKRLRAIKTWQLLVLLLLGTLVTAIFLRINSLNMSELRRAVVVADEKGDPVALKTALGDLQKYVLSHMNTSLGKEGFFLTKSYERDRDSALSQAASASNPNSAEYQKASIECQEKWQGGRDSFRNDYVRCVIDRVSALSGQSSRTPLLPVADSYRVNYASPAWSFDLAGLGVAFCIFVVVVIVARFIGMTVLRLLIKKRFISI